MRKREFLASVFALGTAASIPGPAGAALPPETQRPPNLLFITVDDLNWSLLGFMGNPRKITPNLDALAARSHRFVNNRTIVPICQPAREAMMTGLWPQNSGGTGFTPVKEGTPTLPTLLKKQGYYTAGIHKLEHMQPPSCFPWDFAQSSSDRNPDIYAMGMRTAILEARGAGKPFFINCNINDPHRPFYGSPGGMKIDHDETGPYKVEREIRPEEVVVPPFLEDLPQIRVELAQYWNNVQRLDVSVGKILTALRESGEADNTIVLFSSDHGMPFPFAKATTYDNGTRVPVLLSWPGMGMPQTIEAITANIDILPTLLELLKVTPPQRIDGNSWLPLVAGKDKGRDYLMTQVNTMANGLAFPMRTLQDGQYALVLMPWADGETAMRIESMNGLTFNAMVEAGKTNPAIAARVKQYQYGVPLALYDLPADPGQRVNLLDSARHRTRVEKMKATMLAEMKRTQDLELDNFERLLSGQKMIVPKFKPRFEWGSNSDG